MDGMCNCRCHQSESTGTGAAALFARGFPVTQRGVSTSDPVEAITACVLCAHVHPLTLIQHPIDVAKERRDDWGNGADDVD